MPAQRINFPETLPERAKFSGDRTLNESVSLVRAFKDTAWISRPLMAAINDLAPRCGRPRMKGEWALVAIAFIASRQGDIQPFYDRTSLELWHECGFDHIPSYTTTHARLTELEHAIPEIEDAIGAMIQHFIKIEPRIGRHVHIDGTEADTHSRFFHACKEGDPCGWLRPGETIEEVNRRVLGTATTDSVQRQRQKEDAGEADYEAEEAHLSSVRLDPSAGIAPDVVAGGPSTGCARNRKQPLYSVETSKHVWQTHDPDAGFRSYLKPGGSVEGWHGYYHLRGVDDFTGLTLYGLVESSSRTESSQYEKILRGIVRSTNPASSRPRLDDDETTVTHALRGADVLLPEAILGDRGFGYPFIYEMNTALGIQTVAPWRNLGDGRKEPTDITLTGLDGLPFCVDRHGVIHCKYCGGPTKRLELRRARDENPRIYVQCLLPSAGDSRCRKRQSVSCHLDPRMLTPLARNDNRYLALEGRFQFERVHNSTRIRNRNGAKDPILRPKRLGQPWQQLLVHLGNMVDWFRAGLKHDWLNEIAQAVPGYPKRILAAIRAARRILEAKVARRADAIRQARQAAGLDGCYWPPEPEPPPPKTAA
jgi:hypothetical protein